MKLKNQKIKYKQLPRREDMIELYETHTLEQIADLYGTTKTRVGKWFDKLKIPKRQRGGGNNRKFIDVVTKEQLIELIKFKKTNKEISKILGCSVSNVCKLLFKYKIKREYDLTEYKKYSNKVRKLTEKNYVKYKNIINPNNYPRTLCGVPGGYQIDHKLSVRFCYDNNIMEEVCASVDNLQILKWSKNLNKRYVNIFEENYVRS